MIDLPKALKEYRNFMGEGDFRDFMIDLISTFKDVTPEHIVELKDAFANQDAVAFRRAAHSLKSSGRTFNLAEFTAIAAELEIRGCLEDSDEITELIQSCELKFESAKISLEELCKEL